MQAINQYLADINQMWQFVDQFSARVTSLFKVEKWAVDEMPEWGGPLVCTFHLESFAAMPTEELLSALAEPWRTFSFPFRIMVQPDSSADFGLQYCFFQVTIDYAQFLKAAAYD